MDLLIPTDNGELKMEAKLNSYGIIAKGCTMELVNGKTKPFI